jgi:hypothetical protein
MHHASYPVLVHRPAALDWASNRSQSSRRSSGQEQSSLLLETPLPPSAPRLTTTHLPFSLPSALRSGVRRTAGAAKPGHRTCTYEVTRHARRTRLSSGARRSFIAARPLERWVGHRLWMLQPVQHMPHAIWQIAVGNSERHALARYKSVLSQEWLQALCLRQ